MPKNLALTKVSAKPARVAPLLVEVRGLILAAREQVARARLAEKAEGKPSCMWKKLR